MFSKGFFPRRVKRHHCVGMGQNSGLYGMSELFTKQQNFRLIEIVDNKINMTQKLIFFLLQKENIAGKGENTDN